MVAALVENLVAQQRSVNHDVFLLLQPLSVVAVLLLDLLLNLVDSESFHQIPVVNRSVYHPMMGLCPYSLYHDLCHPDFLSSATFY